MTEQQCRFLLDEFFQLTLAATVQRAKVYAGGVSERDRKEFQNSLRKKLFDLWPRYAAGQKKLHNANIKQLAKELSEQHGDLLRGRRFRIGPAQKALNLFLKYLWCAGILRVSPPHCPFDRNIIQNIGEDINWTELDTMREYRQLVTAARRAAKGVGLALWELNKYNLLRP
jgi:hypothetical protein